MLAEAAVRSEQTILSADRQEDACRHHFHVHTANALLTHHLILLLYNFIHSRNKCWHYLLSLIAFAFFLMLSPCLGVLLYMSYGVWNSKECENMADDDDGNELGLNLANNSDESDEIMRNCCLQEEIHGSEVWRRTYIYVVKCQKFNLR